MNRKKVLYTIPFAGGSSYSYIKWRDVLGDDIIVRSLEYAGHGKRLNEPLTANFSQMIEDMVGNITADNLKECEFAIFGHSLGGLIAYYVSIILQNQYNISPTATFISACKPPHLFNKKKNNGYTYDSILQSLIDDKRISKEILETNEFKNVIYPVIVNDYKIIAQYKCNMFENGKLNNKVFCFYGSNDKSVFYTDMLGWDQYSDNRIQYKKIIGDHFFIESQYINVCNAISKVLNQELVNI